VWRRSGSLKLGWIINFDADPVTVEVPEVQSLQLVGKWDGWFDGFPGSKK
jgi:hypothetical protein